MKLKVFFKGYCHKGGNAIKILRIMKMTVFLMIAFCLRISAEGYSQNITISEKNAPLHKVFKEIEKQSGYVFWYESNLIARNSKVNISVRNADLKEVLELCLADQPVTWSILRETIVLKKKKAQQLKTEVDFVELSVPRVTVKGKVTNEVGAAISGVTVMVKGDSKGTQTDSEGNYTLIDIPDNSILVFTAIGFDKREIPVGNKSVINVILKIKMESLEETVIVSTGYQTLSKERTTGSYSMINTQKIENKLQPSLLSVIEGQAAGVVLTKNQNIEIRGVSTITGVKSPLIVVDGYPLIGDGTGLETINPNNVESITVLKDAVAASIYGARASNGVIVVTTKKAVRGDHKIAYKGTKGVTLKPELSKLNIAKTNDYMDAELDLYNQDPNSLFSRYNSYFRLSDYQYLLMAKDRGIISAEAADAQIAALRNNNALQEIQDKLIRSRQSQQHNLNISGGTEKSLFNGDVRYIAEEGNLIENKNSLFTADLKNIWTPKDWISLRLLSNVNYSNTNSTSESYSTLTSFNSSSRILPYTKLYDEDGNPSLLEPVGQRRLDIYNSYPGMKPITYHPESDLQLAGGNSQNLQIRLGGDISIKFSKSFSGSFGGSWINGATTNRTILDANSFNMRTAYNDGTSSSNSVKHYIPEGGKIDENRKTIQSWVVRSQLNYNQSFNGSDHRVTAMIGNEISRDTYEQVNMPTRLGYNKISASYNSGFNPYEYNNNTGNVRGDYLFSGSNPANLGGISYGSNYGVRDNRFVSQYGNASYEFKNKYIISGSARMDLTNFFGTDEKYRYKPTWSVGGKYKISEELFFSDLKHVINRLDLRGSFGVNGNISLNYTPYLILAVGTQNTTTGGISYSISSYPNNQLRWERTKIVNLGVDMAMFNSKLNLSVDYYQKKSTDLIANDAIDQTRGVSSLPQNVGALTNKGLEISLSGSIINSKDFRWNSNLVTSYNTSNVDYYKIVRSYFGSYATAGPILVEGYPMDGFWGAKFAGLNNKGGALYYNKKGEKVEGGSLNAEDAQYFGTLRPKVDMSLTNTFRYRNFEGSFMFIGKFGAKYRKDNFSGSNYSNRHVADRWRKPGDELTTIYPVLKSWNMDMFDFPYSDVFVGNANFVKLRDVTLGYYLPQSIIGKIGLSSTKIYFQTRNLFYMTASGVDIDPETAEYNASGGTGAMTNQGFTSLQLRPEFYFGISINL